MVGNSETPTDFSAADSAVGYLYQVRLALLSALERLARGELFTLFLESLDDVVFDTSGSPLEILQLKHHRAGTANLTDASPDLWKSLRIWMDGRSRGTIPADARLFLMTTNAVGTGTAASKLMVSERDEAEAVNRLTRTATQSTNEKNEPAYTLFRALSDAEKPNLADSIVVAPKAPNINDVGDRLLAEARLAVRREHLGAFAARLEGWWFQRALRQLATQGSGPIFSEEIESEWHNLQEQFKSDSLPVDRDILAAETNADVHDNSVFVHQARLAGISNKRILTAVRDYFRAFAQRSRWVREDLLLVGELQSYERLLREEWEIQFDRLADELGDAAAEDAMRTMAQEVYAWVEKSCFPIRPRVLHPSLTRGSFHILADELRVGWHPQFMQRLQHLLEPREAS